MNKKEILKTITEWERVQKELDDQIDKLYELIGYQPESKLLTAIYTVSEAHTNAVELIIGDEMQWLDWWKYENKYGESGLSAGKTAKIRPVKTLSQLAGLIAE